MPNANIIPIQEKDVIPDGRHLFFLLTHYLYTPEFHNISLGKDEIVFSP